jgi:hypothetical protein
METFECFEQRGYSAYAVCKTLRQVTIEELVDIENGGKNTIGVHNFSLTDYLIIINC